MDDEQLTAFFDDRIIARGPRPEVTRAVEQGWPGDQGAVRVFNDSTGRPADLDLWDASKAAPPRPRGRPRLGVVAREVTLLPRHWAWLAAQPGGASAALRRLVDSARRESPGPRERRDAVYRFLSDIAGDRPGYEEAVRALYRGEIERFRELVAPWPQDVRGYAEALLEGPGGASPRP